MILLPRALPLLLLAAGAAAQDDRSWRPLDHREGLPSDEVLDLARSGPRIWAATAAGLVRIEAFGMRRAAPAGVARLVAPAPDGRVFALYATAILKVGDEVEERIDLPVDAARAQADGMDALPDGTLLLRIGGTGYVRPPGGPWREGEPPSPRAEVVHEGEAWVATRDRGILRRREAPLFRGVELPRSPRVHALARGQDGTIWCGTSDGLAAVRADGSVTGVSEIDGAPLGVVTAAAVDGLGRLWIGSGSSFKGVYRLEGADWRHLDGVDGYVHRITVEPSGALWFAVLNTEGEPADTGRGAWCFQDGEFKPAQVNVALPSGRVYDVVARDRRGTLWFATLKGLAAYEGPDRVVHYLPSAISPTDVPGGAVSRHVLLGEKVWCLCAAHDGAIWIGYQNTPGVSRLLNDSVAHFEKELVDGNVWSIAEGKPGVLWFATGSGLSRYDGLRWSSFRNEEGLGEEALWPLLPLEDGSLWVGTLGAGVVHLDPRDRSAPRTRFKAAAYESREGHPAQISWAGTDAWYETPAADLVYRWRIDGKAWSLAGAATAAQVAPPAGRHVFEVQAIDRFGNVEDPPARIEIVVVAPSRFPYALAAVVALALLAIGYLVARRRGPPAPHRFND